MKAQLGGGMKNEEKRKRSLKKSEKRSFKEKGIAVCKIKKKKKKTTKWGGFLPIAMPTLLALVCAIINLVGGVAGVANTVFDMKAAQKNLAEHERHNHTMEVHGK